MTKLDALRNKIIAANHQRSPLNYPPDFFHTVKDYWPLGMYMLRKFGWKSWYSFWYTKLFVADEGGEYDLRVRLFKKFPGLLKKPFKLEIEHSTICNKKCTLCAHTHWEEKQEQMSFEKFKYALDSIPSLKWVNIAGIGSAFLHKDLIGMIEYARSKHINVNFVDEFDFFDGDKARKIIELGVNSIYVSFDAYRKETYETIKKGCDYDKSLHNIRTLLEMKGKMGSPFPVVHFRFLINKTNYKEMPDYINLIASLPNRGVRARVEFIGLITFPGIEDYYISLKDIPEDIIEKTYENALKHNINLYFSHPDASCLPSMSWCVRWSEPFVLVDGTVISDCAILMQGKRDYLKGTSFGNVFETPFMDIWNSKRYRDFRKHVVTEGASVPRSCLACCAFNITERADKHGVTDEYLTPEARKASSDRA